MRRSPLPLPGPDALAASRALTALIEREITEGGGWIPFSRYMELALYAPGLGYYAGGSAKLGAPGDFVTAPEMGGLFARALARQVAPLIEQGGEILEFGAGSGALAAALLGALAQLGVAPPSSLILEPSAELAARQRVRLEAAGVTARVRWIDHLPRRFRGVMIANEVVDAMPVHALAWTAEGVFERGVKLNGTALAWTERPAQGAALAAAQAIAIELPPSGRYESEINLFGRAWMRALAKSVEAGALLVIDYGFPAREYYHPQRSMGTIMCHYRHHAHGDPFFYPGLQDITAHVDFSALEHAANDAGLELLGYAPQASFLVNCGITGVLAETDPADTARYAPLAAEANRLLSPAEMGELFKVLAVGRGVAVPLLGFTRGERSRTL
jgi:SAM-dependent MidA family methyltransferase